MKYRATGLAFAILAATQSPRFCGGRFVADSFYSTIRANGAGGRQA